ncbi:hypothetical protein D3C71_20950 [compost metagenome]
MTYALKTINLYYTSGSSDKEYIVTSQVAPCGGYNVFINYGRRARATTRVSKTTSPVPRGTADRMFHELADAKVSKGYTSDLSGTPHAGVSYSSDIHVTPLTAPAPAPESKFKTLLAPAAVVYYAGGVDSLLTQPSLGVQQVPDGERLMTLQDDDVSVTLAADSLEPGLVSEDVKEELRTALAGWVLEGYYAAGMFTVCDGFHQSGENGLGRDAPLQDRIKSLDAIFKTRRRHLAHVRLASVYFGDEAQEAMSFLRNPGLDVFVRNGSSGYDVQVAQPADAYYCRTPS